MPGGAEARGVSARQRLAGRVLRIVRHRSGTRVIVDCGFPLVATSRPRSVDELGLREGAPVTAHFKATAPHLMRHGSLDSRATAGVDTPTAPGLEGCTRNQ